MTTSIAKKGHFWLPESPHKTVAGELLVFPDGKSELDLLGALEDPTETWPAPEEYQVVHGLTEGGPVTLTHCSLKRWSIRIPGPAQQTLRPVAIFEGSHLLSPDPRFGCCEIALSGLMNWIGMSGSTVKLKDRGIGGVTIDFEPLPTQEAQFSNGTLAISFGYRLNGDHLESSELIQSCVLKVQFTAPSDLESVLTIANSVQHLLAIARGRTGPIQSLRVWIDAPTGVTSKDQEPPGPVTVHVPLLANRAPTSGASSGFSFSYSDIGGVEGITKWVDVGVQHREILALLESSRSTDIPFEELRYLSALMAAEWLDRKTEQNRVLPKAEFKEKKQRVLAAVPEDEAKWLHSILQHANEPRLVDRLERLINRLGDERILLIGDAGRWAEACKRLRNGLVHPTTASDSAALTRPLLFLGNSVYYVVVARILLLAGASPRAVSALFQSRHCQWISKHLEESIVAVEAAPR